MEIKRGYFSEYFRKSVMYLGKSKIIFFIFTFIEFVEILSNLVDNASLLFNYNTVYSFSTSKMASILLVLSPYHYYYDYISNCSKEGFTNNQIVIIIFMVLYIWFLIFFCSIKNNPNSSSYESATIPINKYIEWLEKFEINFFDFFLFRLLGIYSTDCLAREIIKITAKKEYTSLEFSMLFISFLLLLCFVCIHFVYYSQICVWSNFKVIESYFKNYPYDSFFSSKYDIVLYVLKLLIVFNRNYLDNKGDLVDFLSEFLTITMFIVFFGFFIYIMLIIFISNDIMYFIMSFTNKIRFFIILFLCECLLLRIILHQNQDYKPYLIYCVIFVAFDIYVIVFFLEDFIFSRVVNNQNFLGVCWFLQTNEIDIQHFTTEWITNHRTECRHHDCLICAEVGGAHDILAEYSLCEDESANLVSKNILHLGVMNKNKEKKKTIIVNKNIINKIFTPYKFSKYLILMTERSKNDLGKDDLIRLDFLYLTVLFLSEKSIEFFIFNQLSFLINKYYKNTNVFISLILVFEFVRNSNLNIIKGYDIIKKNEELRNSLTEYIKEFENFIHFGEKSPLNYIHIAKKYYNFKTLVKSIHLLFKKNIECNYQLLLMRYCYETLLHLQFKNMQPFDLNYYSDFLDYHFNNDKLFLIKYIINYDRFMIVKGSKEILGLIGKNFEKIFPETFEIMCKEKFKSQLFNKEQKDIKPLFECIIKSLTHSEIYEFIDWFKMKYFSYPTNTINELLIQGNYVNGYTNVIMFLSSYGYESLYSFSPQVYKFLGITPNIISVLKKTDKNIFFNTLFTESSNTEGGEKVKGIYLFSYKKYLPLFRNLLSLDALKDVHNYFQIQSKLTDFTSLADSKKEILFSIQKKMEFVISPKETYVIYSIKEIKKKRKGERSLVRDLDPKVTSIMSRNENTSKDEGEDGNGGGDEEEDEFSDQFEGKGMMVATSTLSSSVSFSAETPSTRSKNDKGKKGGKADEKNKKNENLQRYTVIILVFGFFLMIITILFLVLEIRQNQRFQSLFSLFKVFRIMKRGIECSPLNLLTNYHYYSINYTDGINIYEHYSNYIKKNNKDSDILSTLNLNKLIMEEVKAKYESVMDTFDKFKNSIFILGSDISEKIFSLGGYSFNLIVGKVVYIRKTKTEFISLIREYNNIVTSLLENDCYQNEIFSLIAVNETNSLDISLKIHKSIEITETSKNMLLLILIYPFIHNGLSKSSLLIEELFQDSMRVIEKYLIIFFTILLVLHLVLAFICVLFLYVYINLIKINIQGSNLYFSDKKFMELQIKRIETIKIMNMLYSEHPLKIVEKIDIIDEIYRRKTREDSNNIKGQNKTSSVIGGFDENTGCDSKSNDKSEGNSNRYPRNSVKDPKKNTSNKELSSFHNLHTNNTREKKTESLILKTNSNLTNNLNKDDLNKKNTNNNSNNESNYEDKYMSKTIKITKKQYKVVIEHEILIIICSFGFYYLYNIIFFIFVYIGKNKLNWLVDYCDINNSLDSCLFDSVNSLMYLYLTNCSSIFYGQLVDEEYKGDYLEKGLADFYKSIEDKRGIEVRHHSLFPIMGEIVSLNCSEFIIKDDYYIEAFKRLNVNYEDYYLAICHLFPVASTGDELNMLMEVYYSADMLYHKFKLESDFEVIFNEYLFQFDLFNLYTYILTLVRIIRDYFNNTIFDHEIEVIFTYFSTLILVYLVLSVVIEIVLFFILNFAIIIDVRNNNKLMMEFIASLSF